MNNKMALIGVLLDTIFVTVIALVLIFVSPIIGITVTHPIWTLVVIFIMTFLFRWIKYKHNGKL